MIYAGILAGGIGSRMGITSMVLERGLTLIGRSRSTAKDFEDTRDLLERKPDMQSRLCRIVRNIVPVRTVEDITSAFTSDYSNPYKTVMQWLV